MSECIPKEVIETAAASAQRFWTKEILELERRSLLRAVCVPVKARDPAKAMG